MRRDRRILGAPLRRSQAAPLAVVFVLTAAMAGEEGAVGQLGGRRRQAHPIGILRVSGIRVMPEEMRQFDRALARPERLVAPRPGRAGPRPISLPGVAPDRFEAPPRGPAPSPAAPQLSLDFPGMQDDGTVIPPDTHGAAGPDHLVSVLNMGFAVFNKNDGALLFGPISLQAFWAALGTGPGQPAEKPFDPRVLFDQFSGRYLVVSIGGAFSPDSWVLLAVSVSSDPTQGFDLYAIDADAMTPGEWADFPMLGIGPDHVYISANMYAVAGCPPACAFTAAKIWVVEMGSLLAGGPLGVKEFRDGTDGFTWLPTHAFGPTTVDYIVSEGWSAGATTRFLRIQEFSFPAGSPVLSDLGFIQVDDYGHDLLDDAPQSGCSETIETNDWRLLDAVLRNGKIWTTHQVDDPIPDGVGRTEVAWYEIDPFSADGGGTSGPIQQGRVADPDRWYYYPSIAVNADESVALGFSGSGPNDFVGGYYTARGPADPPGTMHQVSLLKAGEAPYSKDFGMGENRWGDYSATVIDPLDDRTFWTIQAYAADEISPGCPGPDTGRWGTWWGRFSLTCIDLDGDGFGAQEDASCRKVGLDCDDTNASVFPGASEICGAVDTDCDDVPGNVGGDADGSGRVDGGDLWEWARRFGAESDPSTPYSLAYSSAVDFDRDGDIDGVDLSFIEQDFGKTVCP